MKPAEAIAVGALCALVAVGGVGLAYDAAFRMQKVAEDEIAFARTEAETLRQATASMPKIVTPIPFEDLGHPSQKR